MSKMSSIKRHLLDGRELTQLQALGLYGAFRLAARIKELRNAGWIIETEIKRDPKGSTYAVYRLPPKVENGLPERYVAPRKVA